MSSFVFGFAEIIDGVSIFNFATSAWTCMQTSYCTVVFVLRRGSDVCVSLTGG